MTNHTVKALLLALVLLLSSCGYEMSERGVTIDDTTVTNIAVPTFHNTTLILGVEADVTTALRRNVINSGVFDLYPVDKADIVLHGEITSYGLTVLALNNVGSATEYRLSMTIKFTVKNNATGNEIYNDSVSGTWDFRYTSNTIDNRISQGEASTNLSNELAQEILLLIRERFSHNPQNF